MGEVKSELIGLWVAVCQWLQLEEEKNQNCHHSKSSKWLWNFTWGEASWQTKRSKYRLYLRNDQAFPKDCWCFKTSWIAHFDVAVMWNCNDTSNCTPFHPFPRVHHKISDTDKNIWLRLRRKGRCHQIKPYKMETAPLEFIWGTEYTYLRLYLLQELEQC